MSSNGHVELQEFRVVFVLPKSHMILATHHGNARRLPRISIPKWTRVAQQLTEALQAVWTAGAIVIDLLPESDTMPACAVVEVRASDWKFAVHGFMPLQVGELDEQELTASERFTVCSIIAGETRRRGPFSRIGWIEEAQEWICESVHDHQVEFSDDVRCSNMNGSFALVRFGTLDGPAYWLKATGAPNEHEFTVTQTLAHYCRDFVPPVVAARADWNAWVTEEAGQPLHDSFSFDSFEQATRCLAGLQITSARCIEPLLASGCFDQRVPTLRAQLPELMQYLTGAMARQTSTRVPTLSAKKLDVLVSLIEEASFAIELLGIPYSLIHNDMNPGNILFDGIRAVFTDWSEAGVGIPFLTFQHLQAQSFEADETHTWGPRLREIYKEYWRNLLSESQIERALALSPPLAIASYLCGRDPSFTSSYRSTTPAQSYARSLARRMDRYAQSPEFREALCS